MQTESADKLSLTEASFRLLEEAYERQWIQARLACEAQTSRAEAHVVASASSAAEHMCRLWGDTVRLHRRFVEVTEHKGPGFTQEERASLRLLGFRSPSPPLSDVALSRPEPPLTSSLCGAAPTHASSQGEDSVALRKECARLRHDYAQLLSTLAWYKLCEHHAHGLGSDTTLSSPSEATSTSISDAYAELAEVQHRYRSLLCPTAAEYHLNPFDGSQRAEDFAIAQLLRDCAFPPQVRVARLGLDSLFMVDRPVFIGFASPQSATLVVRDPDGLEDDCTLETYLTVVYAPLLRAVQWRKPSVRVPVGGNSATTSPQVQSLRAMPAVPLRIPHTVRRESASSTRHSALSALTD
ncbi:hypothetical protein GH5_05021 [Leishmania sp. Ghana 2012 LV757]|uniref:hypothetical protein n=1 Tax=Leishmania sp. Ghana 2012 LV757 TaxID=2803181 RepID=UPI001B5C18CF|nr:hypothetical protein GH5_05021 [Leishmania sp. Ghana 2012 LV757]